MRFLDYFKELIDAGLSEDQLFDAYKRLHTMPGDEVHQKSWFRDQVLHPHETQHTLKEILPLVTEEGFELIKTSVNEFRDITDTEMLFKMEEYMERTGEEMLNMGSYYPGFFEVFIKNKNN